MKKVEKGELALDEAQAHHLLHVLRIREGQRIEVFDAEGRSAVGIVVSGEDRIAVRVEAVGQGPETRLEWIIASAAPKGHRADWLVEKISELGTSAFVPLITQRSVVHPEKGKLERWARLAAESAKQSRRVGVMRIEEPVKVEAFVRDIEGPGWVLSTAADAVGVLDAWDGLAQAGTSRLSILIGPEGGWTEGEMRMFREAGLTDVGLGETILRIETAAVSAAAIVAALLRNWPTGKNA